MPPVPPPTKPFLKWPGGKRRVLSRIAEVLPPGRRLIEPFAGSAAVSLGIDYPRYVLADANAPLINLYRQITSEGDTFIRYCRRFFKDANNCAEVYYQYRDRYNKTDNPRLQAALLVWINRHTYNGLYRVNAQGRFNAPFGRYTQPYFPETELRAFALRSKRMTFRAQDYRTTLTSLTLGDVVYCDPPYVPLSATAYFTDYAAGGFTVEDQVELAVQARRLAEQGIPVVISNHDTAEIRRLYRGAKITGFQVRRSISQDVTNRGTAGELLALFT
jgi:DNA adenine methylase